MEFEPVGGVVKMEIKPFGGVVNMEIEHVLPHVRVTEMDNLVEI